MPPEEQGLLYTWGGAGPLTAGLSTPVQAEAAARARLLRAARRRARIQHSPSCRAPSSHNQRTEASTASQSGSFAVTASSRSLLYKLNTQKGRRTPRELTRRAGAQPRNTASICAEGKGASMVQRMHPKAQEQQQNYTAFHPAPRSPELRPRRSGSAHRPLPARVAPPPPSHEAQDRHPPHSPRRRHGPSAHPAPSAAAAPAPRNPSFCCSFFSSFSLPGRPCHVTRWGAAAMTGGAKGLRRWRVVVWWTVGLSWRSSLGFLTA